MALGSPLFDISGVRRNGWRVLQFLFLLLLDAARYVNVQLVIALQSARIKTKTDCLFINRLDARPCKRAFAPPNTDSRRLLSAALREQSSESSKTVSGPVAAPNYGRCRP